MGLENKAEEKLIEFAKKNPKVGAIYKGHHDEEPSYVIYYFVKKFSDEKKPEAVTRFDEEFTNELNELDIKIMEETGKHIGISHLPFNVKSIKNYNFLEECIYKKE